MHVPCTHSNREDCTTAVACATVLVDIVHVIALWIASAQVISEELGMHSDKLFMCANLLSILDLAQDMLLGVDTPSKFDKATRQNCFFFRKLLDGEF